MPQPPPIPDPLPTPDGKPADESKPVQVFIPVGQSNMVGMGDIAPDTTKGTLGYLTKIEKKYLFPIDDKAIWTTRTDVYYYDARTKRAPPSPPHPMAAPSARNSDSDK